ncbi:PAS domain S-box protein [Beijerinckia sp. L45]|uniref:PAS domain S-box protein n=1 Tax=Beijerinckia sp. L45 TaxID=1641855 RepID=UPI00131C5DB6|nr:PAS domain S-box protein [Beijerinckia sp. L45]
MEHDPEVARLRALLAQAGIDPDAASAPCIRGGLDDARAEVESLRQANARLTQESVRTTGNYRLALSFGQAKLATSEAELDRFETILQSAIDFAIIVTDLSGRVTTWNEGAARILGWTADEIVGEHVRAIFTPEDRAVGIPETEMTKALVADRANDERWHVRKSGERFYAVGTMMPLRADDGTSLGFLKILRDQTEPRLAEEQLRDSEAFTRSILAASRDCIKVLDADGRVTAINENGLVLLEATSIEELQGRPWIDFWSDDRNLVDQAIAAAERGDSGRFQARCPTTKGTLRWWDVVVTRIAAPQGQLLVVSRDITEAKEAELSIAASAHRLQTILDTIPIGVLIADRGGRIIEGNQRVAEILKHTATREFGDVSGNRWVAFHEDGRQVQRDDYPLGQVLRDGEARSSLEVDYQKGDATRGWVRFEAASIQDEAGVRTGAVVAITDIDLRKRAEAQQRFLMGELSHRVKNILAVVVSIARQTLRNAKTMDDASEALLSRINALASAHDVLMQHQWAAADMTSLVAGAMRLHDTDKQVVVSGPDLRLGPQAALSIALVLHELGTNAVKYGALSDPDGRVDIIWTQEIEAGEPHLFLRWRETGGPPVVAPAKTGFGSRLITHSLSSFGKVTMDYAPGGLILDFKAPMKRIQQIHA